MAAIMNLEERIKKWQSDCLKKDRYHSYGLAKTVARRRGMPRVYFCCDCYGYHMTHKENNGNKEG